MKIQWKQYIFREQYHKPPEWYKSLIIKAIAAQCEYLAVLYWKSQKMAIPLGKTQLLSSMPCFPLAAWAAPAYLCELGESQWNPWGWQCRYTRHINSRGENPSWVATDCERLQKHSGVHRRLQGLLQARASGFFFSFLQKHKQFGKVCKSSSRGTPSLKTRAAPGFAVLCLGYISPHTQIRGTGTICTKTGRCTRGRHAAFPLLTSFTVFWFTVPCVLFHNVPDHAAVPAHFRYLSEAQLPVFICRQCIFELLQMCT